MSESKTPRTDAELQWVTSGTGGEFQCVHAAFARELESDLAAAQATIAELEVALQYVLEDDGLLPRATSACRKVVRAALAKKDTQ